MPPVAQSSEMPKAQSPNHLLLLLFPRCFPVAFVLAFVVAIAEKAQTHG